MNIIRAKGLLIVSILWMAAILWSVLPEKRTLTFDEAVAVAEQTGESAWTVSYDKLKEIP